MRAPHALSISAAFLEPAPPPLSQVLLRDQKEKTRLIKQQATELNEAQLKMSQLEHSLSEARRALRSSEGQSEKSAKQGRADREVLVECVRQTRRRRHLDKGSW